MMGGVGRGIGGIEVDILTCDPLVSLQYRDALIDLTNRIDVYPYCFGELDLCRLEGMK